MYEQETMSWAERKAERKAKKERNSRFTLTLLHKMGHRVGTVANGPRVFFAHQGRAVVINPRSGAWSVTERQQHQIGRGIYNLLHFLATGVLASRELADAHMRQKGSA